MVESLLCKCLELHAVQATAGAISGYASPTMAGTPRATAPHSALAVRPHDQAAFNPWRKASREPSEASDSPSHSAADTALLVLQHQQQRQQLMAVDEACSPKAVSPAAGTESHLSNVRLTAGLERVSPVASDYASQVILSPLPSFVITTVSSCFELDHMNGYVRTHLVLLLAPSCGVSLDQPPYVTSAVWSCITAAGIVSGQAV